MKALVQRWTDNPNLAQTPLYAILRNWALTSPFGEINGKADLRGLPITNDFLHTLFHWFPKGGQPIEIHIANADLSGATFQHLLASPFRLENCLLQKTQIKNCYLGKVSVTGCRMEDATLSKVEFENGGAGLGNGLLQSCKITSCSFTALDFDNMEVLDSQLKTVTFKGVRFKDVTITGLLDNCLFIGKSQQHKSGGTAVSADSQTTVKNLDLSRATVDFLDFSQGFPVEAVQLPTGERYYYIPYRTDFFRKFQHYCSGMDHGKNAHYVQFMNNHYLNEKPDQQAVFIAEPRMFSEKMAADRHYYNLLSTFHRSQFPTP